MVEILNNEKILDAKNVGVQFLIGDEYLTAIEDVSLTVHKNEVVALVGESGSGKSTFATALMGLHNPHQSKVTGSAVAEGTELIGLSEKNYEKIRGKKIGMVFQDPLASLNPLMRINAQIKEAMSVHDVVPESEQDARVIQLLKEVGINNPERIAKLYPHELSGGMRQRVVIAIAIANEPDLIIADEPTTALDVTIQAQILDLIKDIQRKKEAGVILITHDLGVVAETADTVAVMYGGQIVELAPVVELFNNPKHPYTRSLLRANPSLDTDSDELYVIKGKIPSLKDMDRNTDLFLDRVDWMDTEKYSKSKPELHEVAPNHFVRGESWKDFYFPEDQDNSNESENV